VERIARRLPVAFPIHPRTRARIDEFGFGDRLDRMDGLVLVPPQGYLDFLRLTGSARLILTDSGGIQEEAAILEVPCLTLRENTERPATLATGWNRLLGSDPERIVAAAEEILAGGGRGSGAPALWDGGSGRRIAEILDRLGPDGVERLRRRRGG
jgi:UDP-N-acetylglucosamine 2-epimerase (non-hydrolysing)